MNELVFCVGHNKTGTTTIHKALKILGYNSIHDYQVFKGRVYIEKINELIAQGYNAFSDMPVYDINNVKALIENFPKANYIHTIRVNENVWYRSHVKHHGKRNRPFYIASENKDHFINSYLEHNRNIKKLFKNMKLLEICIDLHKGWYPLCSFLGCDLPEEDFPHENRGVYWEVNELEYKVENFLSSLRTPISVYVFGTGEYSRLLTNLLDFNKIKLCGFFDNYLKTNEVEFYGLKVEHPRFVKNAKVIIASSWKREIFNQLIGMGYNIENIILF